MAKPILTGSVLKWKAVRDKKVFDQGQLKLASVNYGELTQAGDAAVNLPNATRATSSTCWCPWRRTATW